jgi:hypothetical protein
MERRRSRAEAEGLDKIPCPRGPGLAQGGHTRQHASPCPWPNALGGSHTFGWTPWHSKVLRTEASRGHIRP